MRFHRKHRSPTSVLQHQSLDSMKTCKAIIKAVHVPGVGTNLLPPALARAVPNKRLQRAFGIENAFTSDDIEFIRSFRQDIVSLLAVQDDGWSEIRHLLYDTIRSRIEDSKEFINLAILTQSLAMRLALKVIFGTDISQVLEADVATVANATNRIWLESKSREVDDITPVVEHSEVQDALRRLCPRSDPLDRFQNPMNKILPAFETMWRVSLRLFLEARENQVWTRELVQYAQAPTKENFQRSNDDSAQLHISAKDIVIEALRLYPPTRRVHRQFRTSATPNISTTERGDIETAHLQESFWGNDAKKFDPSRWRRNSYDYSDILTFGTGAFTCPAKHVFAPRAVGLLAGLLLAAFEDKSLYVHVGWKGEDIRPFFRQQGRLDNTREGYLDVEVGMRLAVAELR
ncbi:hypothetical protein KEM54_006568 [Ascosphaera aggregata]|nr:hypothetical protein KEM54_006568 [Ascosphaera aggregata]